jgi:hypothetical protein
MSAKNQTDDPGNPPRPHHIIVDFVGVTLLQAAQVLDRAAPGKIKINSTLQRLQKTVRLKANLPLATIAKKLGLGSLSK